MENRSSDQSTHNDTQSGQARQSTRKRGRRGTRLKELTLGHGGEQRIHIEFDESWNPIGHNRKRFKSFVALLGRSKASILKNEWEDVSNKVKDQIWETITLTYDVPPNQLLRTKLIQYAGERWKAFKTSLTSRYVFGKLKGVNPCEDYQFLEEETWHKFVESRLDKKFQEKRQKAQELQAKNVYPHRLSRGGYDLLEEKIMKKKLKEREDGQGDSSTLTSPPSPPSRAEKWKLARQTKEGEYVTEEARAVAEKIDSLQEQYSQGSFTPVGRNDILATALGKMEHPGRVRGVGRGVGIKQYFGSTKRHGSRIMTRDEMEIMVATQVATQVAAIKDEVMSLFGTAGIPSRIDTSVQGTNSPIVQSTKDSCIPDLASEGVSIQDSRQSCELYLEDPQRRLVAYGKVYNLGSVIHCQKMKDNQVRVVVERVEVPDAPVPFPSEEVNTVGEALNTFILWPKTLVQETTTSMRQSQPQMDPLTRLCVVAMNIKNPVKVHMDLGIIDDMKDYDFYIYQRDVMELLMTDKLNISILQLFVKYLNHLCNLSGKSDKYGFMCPQHIQRQGNKTSGISAYIRSRLKEGNKQCFLAPYHQGDHWQLMVISPQQNAVTWFCSASMPPNDDFRDMIDTAIGSSKVLQGQHAHQLKKTSWFYPKCQKQVGDKVCGYYVMIYMFNIITSGIIESFEKIFDNEDSFSDEEIKGIQRRWASYFLETTLL